MSLIVLYFLLSTSVFSFYIDVVLTLSIIKTRISIVDHISFDICDEIIIEITKQCKFSF